MPTDPQFPNVNSIAADPELRDTLFGTYRPTDTSPALYAGTMVTGLPDMDLEARRWSVPPVIGAVEGRVTVSVDGGQWTVDERVIRGSVPWTRVRVERDTDVEVYNVLGERVDSYTLEPGEHLLDTPIPVLLIVKRKGE
jgi:hypothetical protein